MRPLLLESRWVVVPALFLHGENVRTTKLLTSPRRPAMVVLPAAIISGALIALASPAQAVPVQGPVIESPVSSAPALRGSSAAQSKVTLSSAQQISLTGHIERTNRATVKSQGLPRGLTGKQTEYALDQQFVYPYSLIATGEIDGANFKTVKKTLKKSMKNVTYTKFNDRKQTGTIQVSFTETRTVTLDDGSTMDITFNLSATYRIQGKKVSYAYVLNCQNFGGSKAGADNRSKKAADMIGKKIGVRV